MNSELDVMGAEELLSEKDLKLNHEPLYETICGIEMTVGKGGQ